MLISCDPRIPKRPAAVLDGGESPLPRLRQIRDMLLNAGVTALVMPCNTAHHWYAKLTVDCAVPFLSLVEAGSLEAHRLAGTGATIGLVETQATLTTGLFDTALPRLGLSIAPPTAAELERAVLPTIAAVKAGRIALAANLLDDLLAAMARRGASQVLLACTELPIAFAAIPDRPPVACIDTTRALARAAVAHWRRSLSDAD